MNKFIVVIIILINTFGIACANERIFYSRKKGQEAG